LNHRYIPDPNAALRAALDRKPVATLHEIRASHPTLQTLSIDHLSMRIGQLGRDLTAGSQT
jgi:hypothetical protein